MRFHYDKKVDALYIRFNKQDYFESDEIREGVIFDCDKNGRLIGIEILDASKILAPKSRISPVNRQISVAV